MYRDIDAMSANAAGDDEQRRAQRKRSESIVEVTDAITQRSAGQLGNLSATGLMLISRTPPRSNAVYQLRLILGGKDLPTRPIEVGVQALWHKRSASSGQVWAGYRIIGISDSDAELLNAWLALPD